MNPVQRFRDFISYPSHSRTWALLGFLILVLAIPLTVNIAQKQQEIRQQAANTCDVNDVCTGWSYTSCFVNEGQSCGTLGGKCVSGSCTVQTDLTIIDPAGDSFCKTSGHHPICAGFSKPFFECLPGPAPDTSKCAQPPSQQNPPTTAAVPSCNLDSPGTWDYECVTCNGQPGHIPIRKCTAGGEKRDRCYTNAEAPGTKCDNGALTETQCNAKLAFCSGGCTSPSKSLGTCLDGRICCQDPLDGFPASANTPKSTNVTATPACKGPTHPDNDCPPCANYTQEPVCSSGTKIKRQLDGAWFCWDGTNLSDSARCAASTTTPDCTTESSVSSCQAAANTCNVTTGTRTQTLDKLADGTTNCNKKINNISCTFPSPTNNCPAPNVCNSSNQCVAQNQPPPAGNTQLSFVIGLDGIGNTGDRKSQGNSSGSTKNPRTSSKSFTIEILDNNNNLVKTVGSGLLTATTQPRLNYNSGSGKYEGSVSVDLTAGATYSVKIQGDKYLKRRLGNITGGQSNPLSGDLVTGAMAGNNFLSAADYGNLIGCLFKPLQSSITFCNLADLDDNGVVDQFDYNLFLREIAVVQDGD